MGSGEIMRVSICRQFDIDISGITVATKYGAASLPEWSSKQRLETM